MALALALTLARALSLSDYLCSRVCVPADLLCTIVDGLVALSSGGDPVAGAAEVVVDTDFIKCLGKLRAAVAVMSSLGFVLQEASSQDATAQRFVAARRWSEGGVGNTAEQITAIRDLLELDRSAAGQPLVRLHCASGDLSFVSFPHSCALPPARSPFFPSFPPTPSLSPPSLSRPSLSGSLPVSLRSCPLTSQLVCFVAELPLLAASAN